MSRVNLVKEDGRCKTGYRIIKEEFKGTHCECQEYVSKFSRFLDSKHSYIISEVQ